MIGRRLRTAALAAALAVTIAGACDRPPAGDTGSTRALALRVRLELLQKLGVDGARVEVEAVGGRVRLAGEVRQRATAELAEQVASGVDGVVAVRNEIEVAATDDEGGRIETLVAEAERELADAALETRVRLALVDRLGSDGFRIGTEAAGGVVTLELPAELERGRRRDAVRTAGRVDGVRRVVALVRD
jgi:osmotically-inducible protein OsmY